MNINNPISAARIKKQKNVLAYLSLAFNDFAYPVYLFGSYATGRFHGDSDVDIAIIAPDAQAKDVYSQACDKMTGLGMNYDILISSSINRLDSSIAASLQDISTSSLNAPEGKSRSKSIGLSFLASTDNKVHSPTFSLENRQPYKPLQPSLTYRRQTGLTLIEIMVAMLIGLFLLGGVLQSFVGSKQTNRMLEALSRLQENGRYAMEFLTDDIRMAGFLGCNSDGFRLDLAACLVPGVDNPVGCFTRHTLNMPAPPGDFLYRFESAIDGFEATSTSPDTWAPTINAAITAPRAGGSDIITIRKADDQSFTVTAHAAPTADLTLDAPPSFSNCDLAVVTNCAFATLFRVSAVAGNTVAHNVGGAACPAPVPPGNSSNNLGRTYGNSTSQVFQMHTISYFIRINPSNQPALYRQIDGNDAQELVEGIEQMQILYGEDLEYGSPPTTPGYGSANYYVPANQVVNMNWVVSIRISLVAVSLENVASQPVNYIFNGDTQTPPDTDRRLRKVFTSTIAVRNRLR